MSDERAQVLLTPDRFAELRHILATAPRLQKLDAMKEAGQAGSSAAALVPDLVAFLASEDYVPCESLDFPYWGHAPLAERATGAIEMIGVAPEPATLRTLLADHRIFELPEATYDQGAYIGDYGTDYVAPAGLAASLVPLLGRGALGLLPELERNARVDRKEIHRPAHRAIRDIVKLLGGGPANAMLAAMAERIGGLPEAMDPKTHLGFDLRDLASFCRKTLEHAASPYAP